MGGIIIKTSSLKIRACSRQRPRYGWIAVSAGEKCSACRQSFYTSNAKRHADTRSQFEQLLNSHPKLNPAAEIAIPICSAAPALSVPSDFADFSNAQVFRNIERSGKSSSLINSSKSIRIVNPNSRGPVLGIGWLGTYNDQWIGTAGGSARFARPTLVLEVACDAYTDSNFTLGII